MLNSYRYSFPADLRSRIESLVNEWSQQDMVERIWSRDPSVWTSSDEAKWLGWLDIIGAEQAATDLYRELHQDVMGAGFTDTVLMGMGGSSLCPEVLAKTFGKERFHILDSTVPAQVAALEGRLNLEKTLFIVASKSGSTLEPNCFKQYFFDRVRQTVGEEKAGLHFIAITDPGSKMETAAIDEGFRHIIYGKPDIGGRFSALSAFGMTAAAVMGIDTSAFLETAKSMSDACKTSHPADNPGAFLGLALGAAHGMGRDKLTIRIGPAVRDLGAWLEQLVAESTGKKDLAIIPVDREPKAAEYSDDRFFAFVTTLGDEDLNAEFDRVVAAGHPAVFIVLNSIGDLGQEFFRWEFATAVAGAVMGINPFDQPDVESAKIEAKKLTEEFESAGELPEEEPFANVDGHEFYSSAEYAKTLQAEVQDARAILNSHVSQTKKGDYFGILAYVEMNETNESLLTELRRIVMDRTGVATCLGFGPRFLHSTGQAYKGGPNTGVFLQIGAKDAVDLPVPGQKYTFGTVKEAQARGDFQVLLDRKRRALRVQLGADAAVGIRQLISWLS